MVEDSTDFIRLSLTDVVGIPARQSSSNILTGIGASQSCRFVLDPKANSPK